MLAKKREPLSDRQFLAYLLISVGLVAMAGMMSGLTLGLMSLDEVDLEVLRRSGSARQRACAERIATVMTRPHRLLVTLLVCNAIAAEALPLYLDRLTDPVTAVVMSVTVVLFFGEIIPQAVCSAYGVELGALSAPFVRLLLVLTAPINIPIGWLLDCALGHRHAAIFRRGELKALVDIHGAGQQFGGHLSSDEVAIIKGALDLTNKTAKAAMTPLDMVFMLSLDATLDEATLTSILASGHSRIPVHRAPSRADIIGILLVKELIMVDPKAGVRVSGMKIRSLPHLLAQTPMYDMLKLFELGRSHMAVLTQPTPAALAARRAAHDDVAIDIYSFEDGISEDEGEACGAGNGESNGGGFGGEREERRAGYDSSSSSDGSDLLARASVFSLDFAPHELVAVGIITIEDVLEELLGHEIVDETDQFVDNMHKIRVNAALLARSMPPHLREALAGMKSRVGTAGAMAAWHQPGSSGGGAEAALGGMPLPGSARYANLPRMLRPSNPGPGSVAGQLEGSGHGGCAMSPPRRRTSHSVIHGAQGQLDMLQPLLDARRVRFAAADGLEGSGEASSSSHNGGGEIAEAPE